MTRILLRGVLLFSALGVAAVTTQYTVKTDTSAKPRTEVTQAVQTRPRLFAAPTQRGYQIARVLDHEGFSGVGERGGPGWSADAVGPPAAGKPATVTPHETVEGGRDVPGLITQETPDRKRPQESPTSSPAPVTLGQQPSAQATSAPGASECRNRDLQIQAQGIAADLSFVGVLRTGTELASQQFSSRDISDLRIVVQWKNLFANHRQRIDLIAPDGSLYQSLSRPLTAETGDVPVETLMPISGTWITRYGLYGGWCVDVFVDQDEKPVASRRLTISS